MSEDVSGAGRLDGATHRLPIRIYYEDTDFSRLVYHANYLRYFERGRSEFLRAAGVSHSTLLADERPTAFAVVRIELDFIAAATIDDLLEVETRYEAIVGPRLHIAQTLRRGAQTLTKAKVTICCIDDRGRPKKPPALLLHSLKPFLTP